MADVDIVIKIPDHLYKLLKDLPSDSNEGTIENVLMKAVENGTPLPKGHGRLIDENEIQYEEIWIEHRSGRACVGLEADIENAPTVLEADKAESEAQTK